MFSIKDILNKPESFFQDKIFEIVYDYNSNGIDLATDVRRANANNNMKRFKYV